MRGREREGLILPGPSSRLLPVAPSRIQSHPVAPRQYVKKQINVQVQGTSPGSRSTRGTSAATALHSPESSRLEAWRRRGRRGVVSLYSSTSKNPTRRECKGSWGRIGSLGRDSLLFLTFLVVRVSLFLVLRNAQRRNCSEYTRTRSSESPLMEWFGGVLDWQWGRHTVTTPEGLALASAERRPWGENDRNPLKVYLSIGKQPRIGIKRGGEKEKVGSSFRYKVALERAHVSIHVLGGS